MLLDANEKKFFKKFGKYFWGVKNWFFRASCFGYRVKGVCPLLLPLVFLDTGTSQIEKKTEEAFSILGCTEYDKINRG